MAEIVTVVAQANTSPEWIDAPVTSSVPDSDAAARLADLLSTQAAQATQATQLQGPAGVSGTKPISSISVAPEESKSMGDRILQNLDSVGRAYKEKNVEFDKLLNSETVELSPREMLRIQAELQDHSLIVDIQSKVVGKILQEEDQLIRLQ
jgi:hypothetical protein